MTAVVAVARLEFLIARRNLWMSLATGLMLLFAVVLTFAGSAAAGALGVDRLTVTVTNLTTLSVYLIPLIALLLSFDTIAGEKERGTLGLTLSYPISRGAFLAGKFLAHLATLATAVGIGFAAAGLLSVWLGGGSTAGLAALARLAATAVLLGATFLGFGYAVSGLVRQPGAAAGLCIAIWLIGIVLYDLALLGAVVADNGGVFTKSVFPWLLVANPADAFRVVNLTGSDAALLASGLAAAKDAIPPLAPQLAMVLWPAVILTAAWAGFRRIEP